MIQVKELVFEYPGVRALDNINCTISRGSITALVGPNGSGKSTLMRCLSALQKPFSGTVLFDGIDIVENPLECHSRVGYLQDFFGLYDSLSIYQSLTYFAAAQGIAPEAIHDRVTDVIAKLNLEDKTHVSVSGLSRGMRQRVAIGQAMVHMPELLILDEPASGLDPEARKDLADLFKSLNLAGMTLLVSSHILAELDEYATDMLVLRKGQLVESGTMQSVQQSAQESLWVLTVAGTASQWIDTVKNIPGVMLKDLSGNDMVLHLSGGKDTAQSTLAELVKAGVPFSQWYEKTVNLQDRYMQIIKDQDNK